MKKLLFLLAICVGLSTITNAQDIGVTMATAHNVFPNSTFTYKVGAADVNFTYAWDVFTDAACTFPAGAEVSFGSAKDEATLTVTWVGPAVTADKDYFVKITKTSKASPLGCPNFKILPIKFKAANNWDVTLAAASSESCSVDLTHTNLDVKLQLLGDDIIHRSTTEQCKVLFTVDDAVMPAVPVAADWLDVSLAKVDAVNYTITVPAGKLVGKDPLTAQSYVIRLFQLQDGTGAIKEFASVKEFTWNAQALPTIIDITF